jgi:hypothetical protein
MTQAQQGEPPETPSLFRPPLFIVGQDRRGNWVVQDQERMAGGLFVTRDSALRYVRSENGQQPRAVVMVSGVFELDMSRGTSALPHRETAPDLQRARRIA